MGTVRPAYRATLESGQSYASRERAARWRPAVGGTPSGRSAQVERVDSWTHLASFTPGREAENEAGAASFGPPSTRTHWATVRPRWPRLASSGVARSDKTFNSVSFSRISSHSCRRRGRRGPGTRGSRHRGNDGWFRENDVYNQCTGWRGDGAMGICHVLAGGAPRALVPGHGELHP